MSNPRGGGGLQTTNLAPKSCFLEPNSIWMIILYEFKKNANDGSWWRFSKNSWLKSSLLPLTNKFNTNKLVSQFLQRKSVFTFQINHQLENQTVHARSVIWKKTTIDLYVHGHSKYFNTWQKWQKLNCTLDYTWSWPMWIQHVAILFPINNYVVSNQTTQHWMTI